MSEEKDRCKHYEGVDDGFYCWKCLQNIRRETAKEIFDWFDEQRKNNNMFRWSKDELIGKAEEEFLEK